MRVENKVFVGSQQRIQAFLVGGSFFPTEILMQLHFQVSSVANSTISQWLKENLGEKRYIERDVLGDDG